MIADFRSCARPKGANAVSEVPAMHSARVPNNKGLLPAMQLRKGGEVHNDQVRHGTNGVLDTYHRPRRCRPRKHRLQSSPLVGTKRSINNNES